MRILMQNRPKGQWIGGDIIQMEKTMESLRHLGLLVEFNDQPLFTPAIFLSEFDIVHMWNFSMEWTKFQTWAAKKHKRKLVCSMIYHETDKFVPYDFQQIMIDAMDACIFLTEGELTRARRHLTIPDEKIHFIPNGIDSFWLTTPKKKYDQKGYILTIGRLDGTKGQLEVAKACKKLGLTYLCVGETIDYLYTSKCEEAGATIIGPLKQKDLIPLYDNAVLNVLASNAEIFPLSVMEAGARGLNSVVATACEWKDIPQVTWCEHGDVDSIKEAIKSALKLPKDSAFKEKLKNMTWLKVAEQVKKIYESISNNSGI